VSKENPYVCPRCGTLVNEVPAECRVCGTQLKASSGPPKLPMTRKGPSIRMPLPLWYLGISFLLVLLLGLLMLIFGAKGFLPGHG
jgi:hypothetical protein